MVQLGFYSKELQDILPDTLGTDDALEKELQDDDLSSHEEGISDTDDELTVSVHVEPQDWLQQQFLGHLHRGHLGKLYRTTPGGTRTLCSATLVSLRDEWGKSNHNPDPITDNEYNLLLEFRHDVLGIDKQASLSQAFERMESSTRLRPEFNITSVLDDFFASTTDPCKADYVCPLGFTCNRIGCQHMCNQDNVCSGHGDCVVGVTSSVHVEISCRCHSGFSRHYNGDQCQDSRMGDGQVTAIVAGILASICLTLVVVVAWLCIGSNSKSSYAFSGDVYSNSTYEHSASKD
ncbi:hypothetical protein PoB_003954600 [Plakobranchus ocellatus]|uniref:EGF-like domain-containing protein n=1 Tax=Plakobranchus ocellatus TaxID=259542 RepID=A0AAV4AXS6_9GAST|nr:hypothetical protein PoB_003954600 [Plakobranchus ocellatus]